MKHFRIVFLLAFLASLAFAAIPTGEAFAFPDIFACHTIAGAVWVDVDAIYGECHIPAGQAIAVSVCGDSVQSLIDYHELVGGTTDNVYARVCSGASSSNSSVANTPVERIGRDDDNEDQDLIAGQGKNAPITLFDANACPGWCTVDRHLPSGVGDPPAGTQKTLYVRLVDENQDPYNGHYIACFDRSMVNNPVVYRFVNGTWRLIPTYSLSDNRICISASSDGSFALVSE